MDKDRELRGLWRTHVRRGQDGKSDARIGLSGSFTLDPIIPYIGAFLLEAGYSDPQFANANYNQCVRACMDPVSEFGSAPLDAVVLLWRLEDLAESSEPAKAVAARDMLLDAVSLLRDRFDGPIVLALPPRPRPFAEGIASFSRPTALQELWFDTLSHIARMTGEMSNLYTVDLEALLAGVGENAALDHRKELLYRQPYTERFYAEAGEAIARILRARKTAAKKCLVLDCDNTIWGGIVGEDGVQGIELSDDMPGLAFRRFQGQAVALRQSGVFIALNSKNNPDDVWEVFDQHTGMALKRTDISASRINWRPKSENLKEIAADLNIGMDALVFVDDSHFEVEEVRTNAPGVTVFQAPSDPADLPILMREVARCFDRLDITDDDRKRVDMMRVETERKDLRQRMTEDEFLASLGLEVYLYPPAAADLARVAQLINKTNQFNVTTKRYGQDDVKRMVDADDHDLLCASVRDKFGEYGLVGVAILEHGPGSSTFDSLLMSCRVLGRGIETAIIARALELAKDKGALAVEGTYIPTNKNQMVEDLFQRHGFMQSGVDANGETRWSLDSLDVKFPAFLTVHTQHPNQQA